MKNALLALAIAGVATSTTLLSAPPSGGPDPGRAGNAPGPDAALRVTGLDVIVPGNEFAVGSTLLGHSSVIPATPPPADPWPAQNGGTHFHSADGLPFPAVTENDLEVGGFMGPSLRDEEVRGLVEFDLAGLDPEVVAASVRCSVAVLGGLFGQALTVFDVTFSPYAGNNSEDLADFGDPLALPVPDELLTLSTGDLAIGDTVVMDVTEAYLDRMANGNTALGVRAQASTDPGVGTITLNECYLQLTEENIAVDIKPGSAGNPVNTKGKGVIPVAILGSADRHVTTIDVTTLAFGPDGAPPAHTEGGHLQDVNRDGLLDLISHYRTRDTGLAVGDTQACVVGSTTDGAFIRGCDSVRVIK